MSGNKKTKKTKLPFTVQEWNPPKEKSAKAKVRSKKFSSSMSSSKKTMVFLNRENDIEGKF